MTTTKTKTAAENFITKAKELIPQQTDLQNIDPAIDDLETIDEQIFRQSEYLGGMAAVIIKLLKN